MKTQHSQKLIKVIFLNREAEEAQGEEEGERGDITEKSQEAGEKCRSRNHTLR